MIYGLLRTVPFCESVACRYSYVLRSHQVASALSVLQSTSLTKLLHFVRCFTRTCALRYFTLANPESCGSGGTNHSKALRAIKSHIELWRAATAVIREVAPDYAFSGTFCDNYCEPTPASRTALTSMSSPNAHARVVTIMNSRSHVYAYKSCTRELIQGSFSL